MALKLFPIPFPIVAPPPNPDNHRGPTELRFSRWNNANAEKFNQRRRAQQEIEDDIRRTRRFNSATNILDNFDPSTATATPSPTSFKSIGTPSSPSSPSIPGRKSKYSKPQNPTHPAFRKITKTSSNSRKITKKSLDEDNLHDRNASIKLSNDGLSYVIDGAPFEFKYSYTETPKAKPLKLREEAYAPFGPDTMPRPWTGRAPSQPSKKVVREFDSFKLPPPNKKGVKPVQAPGPYLPGSGPRYVRTREEILGEELTKKEVKELIVSCLKSKRQLNIGRDGLTHNMLDNIHAHWKRRRVCKIKCKGVCTVDMDNVCRQLEEKTGGKVIFRKGGVLYLFRGRNYNYRLRPYLPLMLWKPITPVYPRLIQKAPDGLTVEEAAEMRKKGRKLIPACKLSKNGVYCELVKQVKEAFEECELVRINCQGLNGSDYRKIGAKLRDLVPCVLISFEHEHILMWRGRDWKSSFPEDSGDCDRSKIVVTSSDESPLECKEANNFQEKDASLNVLNISTSYSSSEEQEDTVSATEIDDWYAAMDARSTTVEVQNTETTLGSCSNSDTEFEGPSDIFDSEEISDGISSTTNDNESEAESNNGADEGSLDRITSSATGHEFKAISTRTSEASINSASADDISEVESIMHSSEPLMDNSSSCSNDNDSEAKTDMDNARVRFETTVDTEPDKPVAVSENSQDAKDQARLHMPYMEGVLQLWKQALDSGSAVVLAETDRDADTVYQRSVVFAQSAPPGPVFTRQHRKVAVQENGKTESVDLETKEVANISKKEESERKSLKRGRRKDLNDECVDAVPQGSLKIDELAKLLA